MRERPGHRPITGRGDVALNGATGAAAELRDLTGRDLEPVHEDPRPGDIRHSAAAVAVAESELGFRPERSLGEGLRAVLDTLG